MCIVTQWFDPMVSQGGKPHPKEKELQRLKAAERSPKASRGADHPDRPREALSESLQSSEEDMRSEESEDVQGRQERRSKKPRKKRGQSLSPQKPQKPKNNTKTEISSFKFFCCCFSFSFLFSIPNSMNLNECSRSRRSGGRIIVGNCKMPVLILLLSENLSNQIHQRIEKFFGSTNLP